MKDVLLCVMYANPKFHMPSKRLEVKDGKGCNVGIRWKELVNLEGVGKVCAGTWALIIK